MTIIPSTKHPAPSLPSGKEVAIMQRKVALLGGRIETLRKQCNFFDSLLSQKSRAVAELKGEDQEELLKLSGDYSLLVDQADRLLEFIGKRSQTLKKLNDDIETKKNSHKESMDSMARELKVLRSRIDEQETLLSNLGKEREKAIQERDAARLEKAGIEEKVVKLRKEKKQHEKQMEVEKEVITQEKLQIARQIKDLAIKHGRLQRVAAKYGVKGV